MHSNCYIMLHCAICVKGLVSSPFFVYSMMWYNGMKCFKKEVYAGAITENGAAGIQILR
ncbi:hypothetical protein SAMN05660299_00642 [Megasphaera paucivorans]|uniref:Uncharacterized protein n=1 Tax=Megasphaera paucivorans TaxID=349095 RepID=A0A1G9S5L4_9FIRM|nr:hypothetical protein SAMN05660299_00642 [Megasphaera paucivorans]